ncbi:MAG: hypothetical protein J1F11_11535 [Oscillospiraceae bacterium]|nr:hypothetical protein [Oscillospiraceae bacterium]
MNKKNNKSKKAKVVIVPHYIGVEKADTVIKNIITEEIKKKIKKTA